MPASQYEEIIFYYNKFSYTYVIIQLMFLLLYLNNFCFHALHLPFPYMRIEMVTKSLNIINFFIINDVIKYKLRIFDILVVLEAFYAC